MADDWQNDQDRDYETVDTNDNKGAQAKFSPEFYDRMKAKEEAGKSKWHDLKARGEEELHNIEDKAEEEWEEWKEKL